MIGKPEDDDLDPKKSPTLIHNTKHNFILFKFTNFRDRQKNHHRQYKEKPYAKDLNLPIRDQAHMHPYNQQRWHDHDHDHDHGHQEHHDEGGDGDGHCLLIRQSSVYGQVLALHHFVWLTLAMWTKTEKCFQLYHQLHYPKTQKHSAFRKFWQK